MGRLRIESLPTPMAATALFFLRLSLSWAGIIDIFIRRCDTTKKKEGQRRRATGGKSPLCIFIILFFTTKSFGPQLKQHQSAFVRRGDRYLCFFFAGKRISDHPRGPLAGRLQGNMILRAAFVLVNILRTLYTPEAFEGVFCLHIHTTYFCLHIHTT